ncbi:MAG: NAD(P)/FAD-dependent oxidoreductase, partial [Comamonas sp.]|nr:NAD(P)/FAD-dependent oxidoreductase [Comamonas sp.]
MKYDVIVMGCGMSGILAGIHLKNSGKKFIILEKADTLGGTWRDNTYPGLTCDVPSHAYTYSFEPNPEWSRILPPGSEIQQYFKTVFDKYGIGEYVKFNTEVVRAEWKGDAWELEDQSGALYEGQTVIAATGVLHHPNYPKLKGLEQF